jgi:hypothetical protein
VRCKMLAVVVGLLFVWASLTGARAEAAPINMPTSDHEHRSFRRVGFAPCSRAAVWVAKADRSVSVGVGSGAGSSGSQVPG